MQLDDMTPGWARVLVPLAVLAFLAGGVWAAVIAVRQAWPQGPGVVAVALLPGLFLVYLGWRGVPLTRCLRFQAGISGDTLHHRRGPACRVETTPLADLKVTMRPSMQLMEVDDARTGQRLFTADYFYPQASRLVKRIQDYQREHGKYC